MAWGKTDHEALTAREAFGKLTLDDLRPLAGLVAADPPTKKGDLVPLLTRVMTDAARVADPASEGVWTLSADKILGVVEQGGSVDELEQFLASRAAGDVPRTVTTFLADLRARAGRLADAGPARLIACIDDHVAAELAADRQLRGKCLRAGDRLVVVREADLDAVRKAARRLGFVWPVPPR